MKHLYFAYVLASLLTASIFIVHARAGAPQNVGNGPTQASNQTTDQPASTSRGVVGVVTYRENFDGVIAPSLPPGWGRFMIPPPPPDLRWATETMSPDSPPNDVFAPDPAGAFDNNLLSPVLCWAGETPSRWAIAFRSWFSLQDGFDGGVLEVQFGGGPYTDIVTAGGTFLSNGYNRTISTCCSNPLAGRQAWSGDSGGYVTTIIKLPSLNLTCGTQVFNFRWRLGTDASIGGTGWRIDDVRFLKYPRWDYDFNGDSKTDRTVFRPSTGSWYTSLTGGGALITTWGTSTDIDVAGDYDGDGKNDVAVWRPSNGTWYIVQSSNAAVRVVAWGADGDIPMAGDVNHDGDGKDDLVIYRPSTGGWYFNRSDGTTGFLAWGASTDRPLLLDFDGDGVMDPTVFRPSTGSWYIALSGGGATVVAWGTAGDIPLAGDFDGDGKSDLAVFRPSTGQWFVRNSANGAATIVTWGAAGDVPISGDWDGDARSDFTVWRPSTGTWYTYYATGATSAVSWGTNADRPIGRAPGS